MTTLRRDLENLYDQMGPQLLACAVAVVRCRDAAEDAMHEAFCRVLHLGKKPEHLKAYVYRAVRNAAIDIAKNNARLTNIEGLDLFDPSRSPRDRAAFTEFGEQLSRALLTLAEDERETIVQHIYADLTFREIAELRQRPLGTISAWYRRGIEKLRNRMEE